jgi:hypothetical protein
MKSKNAILCISLIFGWTKIADVAAQKSGAVGRTQLTEPVFGITYDSTKVNYEPIPAVLRRTCRGYEVGRFWTFAHFEKEGRAYYVVQGVWPRQDGDSLGRVEEIDGSKCKGEDSTWMLSGFLPSTGYLEHKPLAGLPGLDANRICDQAVLGSCHYLLRSAAEEEVLRALVDDGIKRGIRAWGGDAPFKQAACISSVLKGNPSTPIVQQELERYCRYARPVSVH